MYRKGRYQPMLRLLSEKDLEVPRSSQQRKKLAVRRIQMFKANLGHLGRDYDKAFEELRSIALQENRGDLLKALNKNQIVFTFVLCKTRFVLILRQVGLHVKPNPLPLIEAVESMYEMLPSMKPNVP